jgi:tRNA-2-methylthio-N6-dimethylallyladenosine synthase
MRAFLGQTVEVLVEDRDKGRWRGRTPHNKLVFFDDPRDLRGRLVDVTITHTGPWSMSGRIADRRPPTDDGQTRTESIPLSILI